MITIRESTPDDVKDIQGLWADADVMRYVWPGGLQETEEAMREWHERVRISRPRVNHYSVFEDGRYCGETQYAIDRETRSASLDIKLFGFARGRGIATKALTYAIGEAFRNGAETVWVDPHRDNAKAIALYQRLGFVRKEMPAHVAEMGEDPDRYLYFELKKE